MRKIVFKYYSFLPLLLLCFFYLYKAIDFPIHDFSNYYFAGKFLANGNFTSSIYFPYWFNKEITSLGYNGLFVNYAPNTPFLALGFLPISFLPVTIAKLVFNGISIGLFVLSIYRLFSHFKINPTYVLLLPILFFVPLKNELLFGQVYFLLFFLLSECFLAYEKEQYKKMALFLSLAILLKVFPVLLVLVFVFKKQFKPLAYLFTFCVLFFGISLLFSGLDVRIFYINSVLPKASNGEIATSFVDNYQSVFMFFKRMLVFDVVENPNSFVRGSNWFFVTVFAFKMGILTIGYFIFKRNSNVLFIFSYWIFAMILLSPYGSTYTFILLIIPFLTLSKIAISNINKVVLCALLFFLNNLPLYVFIEKYFPFSYLRLFLLLVFFSFFVFSFFQKSVWQKALISVCIVFVLGFFLEQSPTQEGEKILSSGSPILIYDYQIINDKLTYFFWDEKGEQSKSIGYTFQSNEALTIKNNQIYYQNKAMTFDKSNKLKPMLIDKNSILYLSDYDRGIGFYTLREIKL